MLFGPKKERMHSIEGWSIGAGPWGMNKNLTDRGERNFQTMGRTLVKTWSKKNKRLAQEKRNGKIWLKFKL